MYSASETAKVNNYANVIGEDNMIRIYPYELVNANHSETFIKPNAVVIPYMKNDYDTTEENEILRKDENGFYYFEGWVDISFATSLSQSSHTSVYGQEIREDTRLTVNSNWYYEDASRKIKTGLGTTIVPAFFTIGKPFDHFDYINDEQDLFFVPEINITKEQYTDEGEVSDPEGDYEFSLTNIKQLESSAENFRIIPQTVFDFANYSTHDKIDLNESSGFTIGLENHTLFGGIKMRGKEAGASSITNLNVGLLTQVMDEMLDPNDSLKTLKGLYLEKHTIDTMEANGLLGKDTIFKFTFTHFDANAGILGENVETEVTWAYDPDDLVKVFAAGNIAYFEVKSITQEVRVYGYSIKAAEYLTVVELESEIDSIDLYSKEPMMPFKMTPLENDDKLEMFADWFDYDVVMPYFIAKIFLTPTKLDTAITNEDDRKLVLDMLTYSAAFADSFSKVPLDAQNKLNPTWKIGSAGVSVANIAGQDPIKIVDGLYESHIRKHPGFKASRERQQRVKSVLCALSRYIYSSYSIGKGQNNFNNIYLPWYLETSSDSTKGLMDYSHLDNGNHVIDSNIEFQTKSIFFNSKFTSEFIASSSNSIDMPKNIYTSKVVTMQTDRKITLPLIPEVMQIIDKLPLPSDIDTNSSKDLAYLWWLPFNKKEQMESIMLNESKTISRPAGTEMEVTVKDTTPGHLKTDEEIKNEIFQQVPGTIVGDFNSYITITAVPSGVFQSVPVLIEEGQVSSYHILYRGKSWNIELKTTESEFTAAFEKAMGYSPGSVVIPNYVIGMEGYHSVILNKQEFAPFKIKTLFSSTTTLSYEKREATFDKSSWRKFIKRMGILDTSITTHHFLPEQGSYITNINEIELKTLWGNYVDIFYNPSKSNGYIRIPLFNKDDETIAKQRIIFA